MRFRGIHPEINIEAIAQATIPYNEFEMLLLKLLPHLPGASELRQWQQ